MTMSRERHEQPQYQRVESTGLPNEKLMADFFKKTPKTDAEAEKELREALCSKR
jgi:hypothetical protein